MDPVLDGRAAPPAVRFIETRFSTTVSPSFTPRHASLVGDSSALSVSLPQARLDTLLRDAICTSCRCRFTFHPAAIRDRKGSGGYKMDTLLAVQKLFRVGALIRDSPPSSSDVFGTKEPHPTKKGEQPLVAALSPKDVRASPSRASPIDSAHPKPLLQASVPIPTPILRKLLKRSSLQSNRMLRSAPCAQPKYEDVSSPRQRARTVSVATGTTFTRCTGPATVRTEPDAPLSHTPPSPSKTKHARTCTHYNVSPLPPSPRPSASYSSGLSSPRSHSSSRQSVDVPTLTISSAACYEPALDLSHSLRRTTSRTTVATEISNESQTIFAHSNCSWQPPSAWAGPSLSPTDEVEGKRSLLGWFSRKKSADGSSAGMRVPTRLSRTRSLRDLKAKQLDDDVKVGGRVPARGVPVPAGVAVKIQSGADRWHEKPMTDIIPKLRNLRSR